MSYVTQDMVYISRYAQKKSGICMKNVKYMLKLYCYRWINNTLGRAEKTINKYVWNWKLLKTN